LSEGGQKGYEMCKECVSVFFPPPVLVGIGSAKSELFGRAGSSVTARRRSIEERIKRSSYKSVAEDFLLMVN